MELRLPDRRTSGAGLVAQPPTIAVSCLVYRSLEGYVDPWARCQPADAAVMAPCMSFSAWSTVLSPLIAA